MRVLLVKSSKIPARNKHNSMEPQQNPQQPDSQHPVTPQPSPISPVAAQPNQPEPSDPYVHEPVIISPSQPAEAQPSQVSEVTPTEPTPAVEATAGAPVVATTYPSDQTVSTSLMQPVVSSEPLAGPAPLGTIAPVASRSKKLPLIIGGALAGVALIGGLVFGWYLPNTPSNVYSTGINRSGKAISSLITEASSQSKLDAIKASTITGSLDATVGTGHYTGDITTSFDEKDLTAGLKITTKADGQSTDLSADVLSQIKSGKTYPDIFFKLSGIKSLGVDAYYPGVSDFDGKWISVSSDYLESIGGNYLKTTDNTQKQITSADISEVARAAADVTQQYLFSTNTDKAVFEKRSFVGKETLDDTSVYHYKVGVNTAHAQAYCVALTNSFIATNAYKKVTGASASEIAESKKSAADGCKQSTKDALKTGGSYDMWIDGHYKLIYKIRVYANDKSGNYTDVGQRYKGNKVLTLFATSHDAKNKADGRFEVTTNLGSNRTDGSLTYKTNASSDVPVNISLKFRATVDSKAVQVTPPTTSVPLSDVLSRLGLGATSDGTINPASPVITAKAEDTRRQVDILSIQTNLEAAASQLDRASYPTLVQINDPTWRSQRFSSMDRAAFTPPNSSVTTFALKATTTQYGYAPTGCSSKACSGYTLSALLSDGTVISKTQEFN